MNQPFCYCSGVACKIRNNCQRYLPSPVDKNLRWIDPRYDPKQGECIMQIK